MYFTLSSFFGDSGGPLIVDQDGSWVLAGTVSGGHSGFLPMLTLLKIALNILFVIMLMLLILLLFQLPCS